MYIYECFGKWKVLFFLHPLHSENSVKDKTDRLLSDEAGALFLRCCCSPAVCCQSSRVTGLLLVSCPDVVNTPVAGDVQRKSPQSDSDDCIVQGLSTQKKVSESLTERW